MTAIELRPKTTAQVLRTVLKAAFPQIKFSVTTGRGAGVSSVRVHWTDGPTVREVEAFTANFEMGQFDGMTDSYNYDKKEDRQLLVNGVHYEAGCRYVMTDRSISAALANECIKQIAEYWGAESVPVAVESYRGRYTIEGSLGNQPVRADLPSYRYSWFDCIHRCAGKTGEFEPSTVEG